MEADTEWIEDGTDFRARIEVIIIDLQREVTKPTKVTHPCARPVLILTDTSTIGKLAISLCLSAGAPYLLPRTNEPWGIMQPRFGERHVHMP
jgi:hypothetical protein